MSPRLLASTGLGATEWRRWLGLGLLVLLAHMALLQGVGQLWLPGLAATGRVALAPLQTRALAPAAMTPAAVAPAAVPARVASPEAAPAPAAAVPAAAAPDAASASQAPAELPVAASVAPGSPSLSLPAPSRTGEATTPSDAPSLPAPPPPPALQTADRANVQRARSAQALPAAPPAPVRLRYTVLAQSRGLGYQAQAELLWLPAGERYEARFEVGAFLLGSRVQTSVGSLSALGLAPTRFADKTRSEQAAHFLREEGRIVFSANTPEAALLPGTQDRLSVFLQLAALLAADPPRYPLGTRIELPTASARELETWSFAIEESESLRLPIGEMNALRLVRQPRREFDQKVEVWLAPAQGFLPVRIKVTQANGDFVDQVLKASETP